MADQEISEISATEEISGILSDEDLPMHRVTIMVHEKGDVCYATYYIHPKGDHNVPPKPDGYIFHRTEEIHTLDLGSMRIRVKEEAEYRGLGHVRNLGL
jgi:hypothetical protein